MKFKSTRSRNRGSALIAVLFLIAILAMASITAIRVVSFDVDLAGAQVHGFRARQLAEMGIAIAANPVVKRSDPLLRHLSEEDGEGFEARIISEGEKFNINAIILRQDEQLMKSMFMDWGLDLDQAQELSDALIDWVDGNDEVGLNGAESEWYTAQGHLNQPFNRPFYDLEEMRMVRGMDLVEALKPDWRNWFTIWSSGALDLNEAPAELIAAAAEITVEEANVIPETVRGADGIRDTDDDKPFQDVNTALALMGVDTTLSPQVAQRFTVNDTTTRLESIGSVAGAKRKITVIVRNRTGRPAVLERTEEVIP
ncbi:general secretion pathway protein GspK [Luteolibacter luteus]|uniref:General secretion pathway protein GspK n=1 Tax=Luteolibacter luteus TaxID=2728835 RepID=A0A858RNS0_9BACT|nr:type II secretion system protein GspK [Luteolibacter luteus]QJE98251.1 general secretion pathway protein GspK [Luteolibacter luteus]